MENFENEAWMTFYRAAILETDQAQLLGKIEAARNAITARIRRLENIPVSHLPERQALTDASSGLRTLQQERLTP
jgi:hypothetical protein